MSGHTHPEPWRTGRQVLRTIYSQGPDGVERLIGVMDAAEDAARAVLCVNACAGRTVEELRSWIAANAGKDAEGHEP